MCLCLHIKSNEYSYHVVVVYLVINSETVIQLLFTEWNQINVIYSVNRSTNAQYYTAGNGTGMIWLDDVICTKTTASIDMCNHKDWGVNNCGHGEDVGVRCHGSFESPKGTLKYIK